MFSKGYNGIVANVVEFTLRRHLISIARFLSNSTWDETLLRKSLKALVLELIWKKSRETKKPIYFIIEDTISEKTKLSSKAVKPIE